MMQFCPACGENVETYIVDRHGTKEVCCMHCGMIVEGLSSLKAVSAGLAIIADDSPVIRERLKEMLLSEGLATEVLSSKDGFDFISVFTSKVKGNQAVSLIVLDVEMPMLNGVNAAMAIRALEKGIPINPTPILFFTSQKCDEHFQKVLAYCKPAEYVNKGVSTTPELLTSRVSQVARVLLNQRSA